MVFAQILKKLYRLRKSLQKVSYLATQNTIFLEKTVIVKEIKQKYKVS